MIGKGPPVDFESIIAPQSIEAPQRKLSADQIYIMKFQPADTTPSVKNVQKCKCGNTGSHNITFFTHGQEGQDIVVLGDGHTTFVHDVTKLKLLSGSNTAAAASTIYKFVFFNGIWYQH